MEERSMDKRLLEDLLADTERLASADDAVMFRAHYINHLRRELKQLTDLENQGIVVMAEYRFRKDLVTKAERDCMVDITNAGAHVMLDLLTHAVERKKPWLVSVITANIKGLLTLLENEVRK